MAVEYKPNDTNYNIFCEQDMVDYALYKRTENKSDTTASSRMELYSQSLSIDEINAIQKENKLKWNGNTPYEETTICKAWELVLTKKKSESAGECDYF